MSAGFASLAARGARSSSVRRIIVVPFDDIVDSFAPDVISYWKFQTATSTVVDEQGLVNATITGAPELNVETIVKFDTIVDGALANGTCVAWPGTTGDFAQAATNAALKTVAGTIVVYFQRETANEKAQLIQSDATAAVGGMAIGININGSPDAYIRGVGGTPVIVTLGFGNVIFDRAYYLIFKWGTGGGMSLALYDDTGTFIQRATNVSTIGLSGTSAIRFGATHSDTNHHDGPYGRVIWMNRRITDAEETTLALARTIVRSASAYRELELGMGPLSLWGLGDASGPQIIDSVSTRHGTYSGVITHDALDLPLNSSDGAASFSMAGSGSGSVPAAGLSLPIFSLSFWFSANPVPGETDPAAPLVTKVGAASGPGDMSCSLASGQGDVLRLRMRDAANASVDIETPVLSIESGTPYHVCIRGNNTGIDLHVNGVFIGKTTAITTGWSNNNQTLQFASGLNFTATANCVLDEVCVFDRVITPTELIELAQRSGTAPVAVGGSATVPENVTTVLDVLANDTYVGTPTIEIMADPTGGDIATAVPATSSVRAHVTYQAGDVGVDTARSFDYRIIDPNGTSNTVTVDVTVQADDFVPVSNANCFTLTGLNTIPVNTMAELQAAVDAAAPGDHITIAPGTYAGGTRTFNAQGTTANPIVIRPTTGRNNVTINSAAWTLAAASARIVIYGLNFVGGGTLMGTQDTAIATIQINGSHNRVSRCQFTQINAATVRLHAATDTRVDHCDFSDYLSNTTRYKRCVTLDSPSIINGSCRRALIDYCHFHDLRQNVIAGSNVWSNVVEPGGSGGAFRHNAETIVDHCLTERINRAQSGEVFVNKGCGITIRFCTFLDMATVAGFPAQYIQLRNGAGVEYRSNWVENIGGGGVLKLFDNGVASPLVGATRNGLCIGNRIIGTGDIWAGAEWESTSPTDNTAYDACIAARFIGNRLGSGNIRFGAEYGGEAHTLPSPARDNHSQANFRAAPDSPVSSDPTVLLPLPASQNTIKHPPTALLPNFVEGVDWEAAVQLAPGDVGLGAPDPLCPLGPQG